MYNMINKKYLKPLLIFVITFGALIALFFGIPDKELTVFFVAIFTLIWISAIIGGVLFGYILGPFFLSVHKKVIGTKMNYGIQELKEINPDKFKNTFRGFFPALMTINFAMIFVSYVQTVIGSNVKPGEEGTFAILIILISLPLMTGISCALFSPVWFLVDSGIVYSNKEKAENKKLPHEVKSVGVWYLHILKGYAGISVILSFINILILYYASEAINIGNIILFPLLPILIMIFIIPTAVILDSTSERRNNFILKHAHKKGIIDNVNVIFEKSSK